MTNARQFALSLLGEIHRGKKSSSALDHLLKNNAGLNPKDRAFITELVYGVLRWEAKLDAVIAKFSSKPLQKLSPLVLDVLRLGVYQLLYLRVPDHAAIHETVMLIKKSQETRATGFVNAILRSLQRSKEKEFKDFHLFPKGDNLKPKDIAFHTAHPVWLVKKLISDFGKQKAIEICKANNTIAPLTIRANSNFGLYVQDESSQWATVALSPKPGERILDACAAPGGKTTHIAEVTKDEATIIALDRSETRCELLKENVERLGHKSIEIQVVDFLKYQSQRSFDRILIDAPCSALGILRRHPEAKWRKKESDIKTLSKVQSELLDKGTALLKPGGVLVYSVCTYTPEETALVVEGFLKKHSQFKLDDLGAILPSACKSFIQSNGTFKTFPIPGGMDGFFIARFSAPLS